MPQRNLINEGGEPFDSEELKSLRVELAALSYAEREKFRNVNAEMIAKHTATKMLIVSGPGTGKSTIFKQRINHWLNEDSSAGILALSFVRKLVTDLNNDIQSDSLLHDDKKAQTNVHTLHKYARSVVEKNRGTRTFPLQSHFRIIGESWKYVVWSDVLMCANKTDEDTYSWKAFEKQLHTNNFEISAEWQLLKQTYFEICAFYNAVGFADLIIRAAEAITEKSSLVEQDFFIIDEYQDFNKAEEHLIRCITNSRKGLLIVGDDDQVLYHELKSGDASLIRALYQGNEFVNAILPFCSRSDFHIVKSAEHFIEKDREKFSIEKIYLPMRDDNSSLKVQVVGCAKPSSAVDYIRKFVEDHEKEIEERKEKLENEEEKDAFLLILTPSRELKFYSSKGARDKLLDIVNKYKSEHKKFSEDYYKVLIYYSLAKHPENNFTFRKVLYYEGEPINKFLPQCLTKNTPFIEFQDDLIQATFKKVLEVQKIIDSQDSIPDKVIQLNKLINIEDADKLGSEMVEKTISDTVVSTLEHKEEEEAEQEELEVQRMSAVELMTIVGAKGLSADHVIIIGFDETNMSWLTKNAFYVAMTRARKSLHIITALSSGGSKGPHSFLDSLPDQHIDFCSYKKTDRKIKIYPNKIRFLKYLKSLTDFRKK